MAKLTLEEALKLLESLAPEVFNALRTHELRAGIPPHESFFYSDVQLRKLRGIGRMQTGKIKSFRAFVEVPVP